MRSKQTVEDPLDEVIEWRSCQRWAAQVCQDLLLSSMTASKMLHNNGATQW